MSGVTRNAVIAVASRPATGVRAITVSMSAIAPLVMYRFWPLSTKPVPSADRRGRRLHVGGVGAGFRFGQRECGQLAAADQIGQPLPLLLVGAEQQQRPHADRMVGVDEDRRRAAPRADHFQQPAVTHLREPAAAELGRRRHAEHAEVRQAVDDLARDVGLAIDPRGIEMLVAEAFELGDRLFHLGPLVGREAADTGTPNRRRTGPRTTPSPRRFSAAATRAVPRPAAFAPRAGRRSGCSTWCSYDRYLVVGHESAAPHDASYQFGSRFSANAASPSRASSLCRAARCVSTRSGPA